MQCCQHRMQSWATNVHIPLPLVRVAEPFISPLWFTTTPARSSNNGTHCLLSRMTGCRITTTGCPFFLSSGSPFLDWGHHHASHTSSRKSVSSVAPGCSSRRCTDFWLLCCRHSWSQLLLENLGKSGILHQRTHHMLASTS